MSSFPRPRCALQEFFGILLVYAVLCAGSACAAAAPDGVLARDDVREFLSRMVEKHGFSAEELNTVFKRVRISDGVLKAIARPAEALPWYRYRRIFLQPDRIRLGAAFWRKHAAALRRAEDAYGVPEEIIVAIIGVETRYGRNIGDYKVIDSLTTLAFDYPQRGEFFRNELEEYLLLTREQNVDPLEVRGSYAGAMGIPQFISSSYRRYAVDFDIDGITDIWQNPTDAIGSIANFFHEHGWLAGGLIALPSGGPTREDARGLGDGLEPDLSGAELGTLGIEPPIPLPAGEKVKLLGLEGEDGWEYWLGFWNFYVITRYNHSALYAMAVSQLAGQIRAAHDPTAAAAK